MQVSEKVGAEKHVAAYIQYMNIVGGDPNAPLMSPQQFQVYKKDLALKAKNKLYVSWINPKKLQCKTVGPSTKCFCDHPFKYHQSLDSKNGKIYCKSQGCNCLNFYYLPIYGSQDFKCACKHSYQQHKVKDRTCQNCPCKSFTSSWACSCKYKFSEHQTIIQTRAQRQKKGGSTHPINSGITSYAAMLDGSDRYQQKVQKYLQQHPDERVKVQQKGNLKKGQTSALQLFQTPLKFGK